MQLQKSKINDKHSFFRAMRLIITVQALWCTTSATSLLSAETGVTFLVTSDSHYDAFEREDRNERNGVTIDQMNEIASILWPDELGGDLIGQPRGVLLLGDVIDDGDRTIEGKNQSEQQNRYFLADFGLDGSDGRLKYPVFEGWGNHDGPPEGRERFGFSFQKQLKQRNALRLQRGLIDHLSENGLHYSWSWGGVHFVQLNLFPADQPHPEIRYCVLLTWGRGIGQHDVSRNLPLEPGRYPILPAKAWPAGGSESCVDVGDGGCEA